VRTLRPHAITIACALIALGVVVTWLTWSGGLPSLSGRYEVQAMVPSAVTVSPGATVRIAGITVGKVKEVRQSGAAVALRLSLDPDHGPLPVDSRVGVRLRSLVGENYVEIVPGRSRQTLPDGGTLPISRANDYVEIDQILDALRGKTRERARHLLQDLGATVGPRGRQLNRLTSRAGGFLREGSNLAALLDDDRQSVSRLVDNLGVLGRSIATRGAELRSFARGARTTFSAIARRDAALRSVIDELPPTLAQTQKTSASLRAATRDVAPVVTRLATTVDRLDPAVKRLRPAAQEGRGIMRELSGAAAPLGRALDQLRLASGPLRGVLPGVRRVLCQARPALAYLAPYAKEVTSVAAGMASATNYYDASGHAARLYVAIGSDTPTIEGSQAISKLLNSGIFQSVHLMGWNPYPKPGQAGDITTGARRSGPNDSQITYPRVEAAC